MMKQTVPDMVNSLDDSKPADGSWYDINGTATKAPRKNGIFIKNGRKYIIQKKIKSNENITPNSKL